MLDFAGWVAVVTGAAGALGGAFANAAARRGMKRVLADTDARGLRQAAGAPIGVSVLCRDRGPEAASDADAARLAFDAVAEDRFLVFPQAPDGLAQ